MPRNKRIIIPWSTCCKESRIYIFEFAKMLIQAKRIKQRQLKRCENLLASDADLLGYHLPSQYTALHRAQDPSSSLNGSSLQFPCYFAGQDLAVSKNCPVGKVQRWHSSVHNTLLVHTTPNYCGVTKQSTGARYQCTRVITTHYYTWLQKYPTFSLWVLDHFALWEASLSTIVITGAASWSLRHYKYRKTETQGQSLSYQTPCFLPDLDQRDVSRYVCRYNFLPILDRVRFE